jgi:hypothetical protein
VSDQIDWSARGPDQRSYVVTLAVSGLLLTGGMAAGLYGRAIPVFSVPLETATKAYAAWCTDEGRVVDAAGDRYLALFSHHYMLTDAGVGLVLTAVALASLAFALRARSDTDVWLRTPERASTFLVLGVGVIVWTWVAMIYSLETDLRRMFFPACADSIGIPIYANTIFTLIIAPILVLVGWAITWRFGRLPAPLYQWDAERPVRSWAATLLIGTATVGVAVLLASSMLGSMSVAAPSFLVAIYLLASTRAALLSAHEPRDVVEPAAT